MNSQFFSCKNILLTYFPYIFICCSGIGFSLQALAQKILSEHGFHVTFFAVTIRGLTQGCVMGSLYLCDKDRCEGNNPLLGKNPFTLKILIMRVIFGFLGIGFAFLTLDLLPVGDATVLIMLGPFIAPAISAIFLKEPWHTHEKIAALLSIIGLCLVTKPSFIFGDYDDSRYIITHTDAIVPPEPNNFYMIDSLYSSDISGNSIMFSDMNTTFINSTNMTNSTLSDTPREHSKGFSYLGVFYGLSGSISAALVYVSLRVLGTSAKINWKNVCVLQAIGQFSFSIPCIFLFKQLPASSLNSFSALYNSIYYFIENITQYQWFLLFGAAIIATLSQLLMTIGMQRVKSATGTALRMTDVISSFFLQFFFTTDDVDIFSALGACVVVLSTIIIVSFIDTNKTTHVKPPMDPIDDSVRMDSVNEYLALEMSALTDDEPYDHEISDITNFTVDLESNQPPLIKHQQAESVPAWKTGLLKNLANMKSNILLKKNNEYIHIPQESTNRLLSDTSTSVGDHDTTEQDMELENYDDVSLCHEENASSVGTIRSEGSKSIRSVDIMSRFKRNISSVPIASKNINSNVNMITNDTTDDVCIGVTKTIYEDISDDLELHPTIINNPLLTNANVETIKIHNVEIESNKDIQSPIIPVSSIETEISIPLSINNNMSNPFEKSVPEHLEMEESMAFYSCNNDQYQTLMDLTQGGGSAD